ncbi:MAG: DUF3822 family protein [Bacteroidota bacterium]
MSIPEYYIWIPEQPDVSGPYHTTTLLERSVDEAHLPACRLIIFISSGMVKYILMTSRGEWIQAKKFDSTGLLSQQMFLRFLFEKEKVLGGSYVEVQIYLDQPAFTLIPSRFQSPEMNLAFGRLLLDDQLFSDEVYKYRLPYMEAVLLMSFPPELKHLLDHYLRDYVFLHPASIVLNIGHRASRGELELYALFEGQHMIVAVYEQEKLLLSNMYVCRASSDVLYYLQLIRETIDRQDQPLNAYYMGDEGLVNGYVLDWKSFGIRWLRAPLPEVNRSHFADGQDLTSWRYLIV